MPDKRTKGRKISNNEILTHLRGGPLTLSELARKLDRTASSVQRPLQKMIVEEIIFREGDKYYIKGVGASENIILEKLVDGPKTLDELFGEPALKSYYSTAATLEKDLKKLSQTRNIKETENKFSLTADGAISLHLCPYCFKKIAPAEPRKIRWFRSDFTFGLPEGDYIQVSGEIHLECFHKLLACAPTSEILDENYCYFCGLPLNPLILEAYFIHVHNPVAEFVNQLNDLERWCLVATDELKSIEHFLHAHRSLDHKFEVEKLYQNYIYKIGLQDENYKRYFSTLDLFKRIDTLWDTISSKIEDSKKKAESWIEKLCGIPNLFYRNVQVFYAGDKSYERGTNLTDMGLFHEFEQLNREGKIKDYRDLDNWGYPSHIDAAHSLVFSDPQGHQYHFYCYQLQKHIDKAQEGR